jgi:hypothetical protein
MRLTKDQILEARPLPFEDVEVPEWGGTVRVRGLTSAECDEFAASLVIRTNGGRAQANRELYCAKLLARCLVSASDERLLTEADIHALGRQSAIVIQRLALLAERLSGLQVQAAEDAAKN